MKSRKVKFIEDPVTNWRPAVEARLLQAKVIATPGATLPAWAYQLGRAEYYEKTYSTRRYTNADWERAWTKALCDPEWCQALGTVWELENAAFRAGGFGLREHQKRIAAWIHATTKRTRVRAR